MDKQIGSEVLVNVILDRSGSMNSNRKGTIDGYNEYLSGLKADTNTQYNVTLTQFDAPMTAPELTVCYVDKPLAEVPDLTLETYVPRGNTPLYDAIGETIRRVGDTKDRPVLCVVITDGMENASTEFDKAAVKALIQQKEAESWKFVFLGANIDSIQVGGSMGVAAGASANYAPGNEQKLFRNMACSTQSYAQTVRSHGLQAAMCKSMFSEEQRHDLMDHSNIAPSPPTKRQMRPNPPVPPAKVAGRPFQGSRTDGQAKQRTKWVTSGPGA